jgi:hypothetical protein
MIDDARVFEILSEICENVTSKNNKRGFISRCPVCGDSQKTKRIRRLHTDYYDKHDDWAITCYNGGCPFRSGNIYSLYATVKGCTFSTAKKYINEDIYDAEAITKALSASKKVVHKKLETQQSLDLDWDDVVFVDETDKDTFKQRYRKKLFEFLLDRCIKKPYAYQVCVAYQGKYQGRVIIPIYQNGEMVYFQGRALFDNIEPKYLNPDVDKELIISNIDKFDRDKWIIVTEGLIDSWMVEDHQGTSLNGGYFHDRLIEKLFLYTNKGVILAPDNPNIDEAGKEELLRYMKEGKYAGKVKYFIMDDLFNKDLNNIRVEKPTLHIYNMVVENAVDLFTAKMRMKLSGW